MMIAAIFIIVPMIAALSIRRDPSAASGVSPRLERYIREARDYYSFGKNAA